MADPAWRYACRGCGSVVLAHRTRAGGWRCQECGELMADRERVDRKRGVNHAE